MSYQEPQDNRCVCGTPLPVAFLQALTEHPLRSYPCPNTACRYVHQFVPPSTLRTILRSPVSTDERNTPIRRNDAGAGLGL